MFYLQFFFLWANLLFPLLVSNVSESLRSLTKNERCERITQVAHQKWATMSDSLRSLRGNERSWANHSGRSSKISEWVNRSFFWANRLFAHFWAKKMSDSLIPSFFKSDVSESLRCSWQKSDCERIAQVAHQKWATVSNLIRLLTKNERPWAIRSGSLTKICELLVFLRELLICSFFTKNEWFAQKTKERIPNPEFFQLR